MYRSRIGGSVEDGGRPARLLLDMDSGTIQWPMISEILVHEHLVDWNMRDIVRFAKQQNESDKKDDFILWLSSWALKRRYVPAGKGGNYLI